MSTHLDSTRTTGAIDTTTRTTTHRPARDDARPGSHTGQSLPVAPRPTYGRGWALAGIGAGLAGIGMVVTSSMVNAVYDEKLVGDPAGIVARLADQQAAILGFHVATMVGAVLMVVFAAGLFRRLRERLGEGTIAPLVAFAGLLGTAVVSVLGTGLDTEFVFAFGDQDLVDPANAAMFNHWIGTVPWCWGLVGLSGLAVHVAGRAGAVPRWLGRTGLVLGGLTVLVGISPLQYLAGMVAPLWLLATAIGFTVGDRVHRGVR